MATDSREALRDGSGPMIGAAVGRIGRVVPVALVSVLWATVTRDAWRIRALVDRYEARHGEARWPTGPGAWPVELRQLHDDLWAVDANYFYPFGPMVLVAVAALWVGALALIDTRPLTDTGPRREARIPTTRLTGIRRGLGGLGLLVLIGQLVLFAGALGTYVTITD